MKQEFEQMGSLYYYEGAEYVFTEDGVFKSADNSVSTDYELLSDTQFRMTATNSNESFVYDYE